MSKQGKLPCWALLFHQAGSGLGRSDHWDLLIQNGDELDSWALDANPLESLECEGVRLAPHRIMYLEWEGELSRDRGTVQRISEGNLLAGIRNSDGCGTYDLELESLPAKPLTIEIVAADCSGAAVETGDRVRARRADFTG